MILKRQLTGFVLIFLLSCTSNKKPDNAIKTEDTINIFFDEIRFGSSSTGVKLFIDAHFDDCGEWGGHIEKMVIYGKDDKELYLDYQKFSVNCDSINKNGTPIQILETEKTLKLNQTDIKSIFDYMQRMIKSKVEERFPGNSGNSFSVKKSDSTLLINVYDQKAFDLNSYNKLLADLKLPATVIN